ncbi:MAG: hypothetical protein IID45_05420 [Planctomycetes bacterium]|nr:hypothetical protein [Planctomycetota bacterium]
MKSGIRAIAVAAICVSLFNTDCAAQSRKKKTNGKSSSPERRRQSKLNAKLAKESFEKGQQAMRRQQWQLAVDYLKDAVTRQPKASKYRYELSLAYEKTKQPADVWFQVRQAMLANPYHRKATQRFLVIWRVLNSKGALDVGRTQQQVRRSVGDPDRKQTFPQENRSRWFYVFMVVNFEGDSVYSVTDIRGITSRKTVRAVETPDLKIDPREWKLRHRSLSEHHAQVIYVSRDPRAKKHKTTLIVERFLRMSARSNSQKLCKAFYEERKKRHPNIVWKDLVSTEKNVIFSFHVPALKKQPSQSQMTRMIVGQKDVYGFSLYSEGVAETAERQAFWLKLLKKVELIDAAKERAKAARKRRKK